MRDTPISRPLFAISSTNRRSTDVYSLKEADDVKLIAVCTFYIPIIEFSPRNVVPTNVDTCLECYLLSSGAILNPATHSNVVNNL